MTYYAYAQSYQECFVGLWPLEKIAKQPQQKLDSLYTSYLCRQITVCLLYILNSITLNLYYSLLS